MPATKLFRSGTCARTLFPSSKSACLPSAASSVASLASEKFHQRRHAFAPPRPSATFAAGSIAQHRNSALHEILQQVAVVAGEFHDVAPLVQAEARDHLLGIFLRVRQPAIRIRREIGILAEDDADAHVFLQLHEKAFSQTIHVQRIKNFALIHLIGAEKALAQRRHPQIHKGMLQRAPAETAAICSAAPRVSPEPVDCVFIAASAAGLAPFRFREDVARLGMRVLLVTIAKSALKKVWVPAERTACSIEFSENRLHRTAHQIFLSAVLQRLAIHNQSFADRLY